MRHVDPKATESVNFWALVLCAQEAYLTYKITFLMKNWLAVLLFGVTQATCEHIGNPV